MNFILKPQEDYTLIQFNGAVDFSSSEEIIDKMSDVLSKYDNIIIDMSGCKDISTSGLRVIFLISKMAEKNNKRILFLHLNETLEDLLIITGFSEVIDNYDNLNSAIYSIRKTDI